VIALDEQVIVLPSAGASLHGVLHLPAEDHGRALVFCHPFAEEKKCAHRAMVEAARGCAEAGWTVLRFDLRGCGDSPGSFADYDLDDWRQDIASAADYAREATGSDHVGLLGLRLGAALAASVAEQRPDTTCLALWEPVTDGGRYLSHNLRRSLIKSMLTSQDGDEASDGRPQGPGPAQGTDFDGYWVSARLQDQLKRMDLLSGPAQYRGPVLVLNLTAGRQVADPLTRLAALYPRARAISVRQEPFWQRIGIIDPGPTVAATVEWLQQL
jgi:exosortase A-associated hydrolase 2